MALSGVIIDIIYMSNWLMRESSQQNNKLLSATLQAASLGWKPRRKVLSRGDTLAAAEVA